MAAQWGGYAAIKYSNLLDLNRIVALVPQYSIDPEDIHDPRYNMFYHADLNANMRIQAQDVSAQREYILWSMTNIMLKIVGII